MQLKRFILLCIILISPTTWAGERIALVIGNSDYQNLSSLKNPQADATAIAKQLKTFGFTLIRPVRTNHDVQDNLNEDELIIARDVFTEAAAGAEIAFLYYSGHGASLGKRLEAHIIPVNVARPTQKATSLTLLQRHSLSLDSLLAGLDKQAALTIAVFDACREIPELAKTKGIFGSDQWRGLGRVKRGRKRIVAYSGSQGQVVADGDGKYSPYTARLLEVLKNNPTQEIGNLFRDVATRVEGYTQQTAEVLIQGVPPNQYYLTKLVAELNPEGVRFIRQGTADALDKEIARLLEKFPTQESRLSAEFGTEAGKIARKSDLAAAALKLLDK